MVNVVFALRAAEAVPEVCGELATAIVENKASQYQVGLIVFGNASHEYIPVQKLTVALVNNLREAAYNTLTELGGRDETPASDFIEHAHRVVRELPGPVHVSIVAADVGNEDVRALDASAEIANLPFGEGRKPVPGPKQVKAVKTFDGSFTIGDPEKPLLEVPVAFYPVTRRSTPPDSAVFVDDRRVVRSSTLKSESGAAIESSNLERGYMYLNELIPVDRGVQELMDGEFPGAQRWKKAFELLATVPEIPPWIPLEHTDLVVGTTKAAEEFFRAFAEALARSKMHAIARLCRDPRRGANGEKKLKGKLDLVALQPSANGQLICSPLPFKEDFKSYYRFAELASEPKPEEAEFDDLMDELVDGMELSAAPSPQRNPLIERVSLYIRNKIADGEADIPPVPESPPVKPNPRLTELSMQLMKGFGIVERSGPNEAAAQPSNAEFDFF